MAITWECYKKPFKDQWIRILKASTNQQISDTTVPGLYMRYSATTGRKVFYLGCRIRGTSTHRNILIGRYGDMNVEDVRTKATILRKQLTEGYDPMQELRERRIREREAAIKKRKVSDLLQEYIDKCAKVTKKPATVTTNISQKRLYIDPVLGDMYAADLKLPILIDFYNDLAKKTSFSTANKVIWLISHFWKWCEKYEYLPLNSNPCARIEKKKNPKIKYTLLDIDGYKKLFKALDDGIEDSPYHPRFYKAIRIIALTGCRYSEISDLKRTEVALDRRVLDLEDSKTGPRQVPLSDTAIEELNKCLNETKKLNTPYVFPGIKDITKPICELRKAFQWALDHAGLPHMRIHDLRHSFITIGANMGENMMAIKDVAGHADVTMTEWYSHLSMDCARNTANNIVKAIVG